MEEQRKNELQLNYKLCQKIQRSGKEKPEDRRKRIGGRNTRDLNEDEDYLQLNSNLENDSPFCGKTREVIFEPNPGPQTKFLASTEQEVLYGGAAGGGKVVFDGG